MVLRPHDPPVIIVETFKLMYEEADLNSLVRILELKGLKRVEMQPILDLLQQQVPANTTSPVQPDTAPAKIGISKFMAGYPILKK